MDEINIPKENIKMYEQVMGKKLSQEELNGIHKEAITPFEEEDRGSRWRIVRNLLLAFLILLIGSIVATRLLCRFYGVLC